MKILLTCLSFSVLILSGCSKPAPKAVSTELTKHIKVIRPSGQQIFLEVPSEWEVEAVVLPPEKEGEKSEFIPTLSTPKSKWL